jgi:hypothetical protein
MPDYKKGKIYKIINNNNDKVYYGSTTQLLCHRLSGHISQRNKYNVGTIKFKMSSYDILDGNHKIILVENYSCNNKEELLKRERYYIEKNECVNKTIPIRTEEEKKEINRQQKNKYHEQNKEQINKRKKEYYQKNKKQISARHKKNNKTEKFKEYQKEWRKKNKERLNEVGRKKYHMKKLKKLLDPSYLVKLFDLIDKI